VGHAPAAQALLATALVLLDLAGTFVFALSGGMAGIKHRLDLFGVLVLSFAAGNAGGLIRDLLLGATPPPGISDWRYIGASLTAGFVVFAWAPIHDRLRSSVLVLDAAGLALVAVSGAMKALAAGLTCDRPSPAPGNRSVSRAYGLEGSRRATRIRLLQLDAITWRVELG
jgi:uncharacterized membrane protein YeiH